LINAPWEVVEAGMAKLELDIPWSNLAAGTFQILIQGLEMHVKLKDDLMLKRSGMIAEL
jgi:hypothetical protein